MGSNFEETLRQYAYYGHGSILKPAPVKEMLEGFNLRLVGKGHFSRVYLIENMEWVVKEGRWDLDLELLSKLVVPLHAKMTEDFLSIFRMKFLPSEEQIIDQYNKYLDLSKYVGFFNQSSQYYHPQRDKILSFQKEFRSHLPLYIDLVEKEYNLKLNPAKSAQIVENASLREHNFLPKEYLLYGEAMHPSAKGKNSSFIFQQLVSGNPLHDISPNELGERVRLQLILFVVSILTLIATKGFVPDLRPKNLLSEANDWMWKTENLFINPLGPKLVDTRWLWSISDNLVKRGFLIPELTISSLKKFLNSV